MFYEPVAYLVHSGAGAKDVGGMFYSLQHVHGGRPAVRLSRAGNTRGGGSAPGGGGSLQALSS